MTVGVVETARERPGPGNALEVLAASTRLGLTSFGGPVAHIGYYHEEYVRRRGWLDEGAFGEIVALCQSLPGPASSQTGMAIGLLRAGVPGAICAWIGFTLPSAIAMVAFAYGLDALGNVQNAGWLHGLTVAAVAVVALAVWSMARTLTPDKERVTIAIVAAMVLLAWQSAAAQVLVLVMGCVAGWLLYRDSTSITAAKLEVRVARWLAIGCWAAFFALLLGLPLLRAVFESQALALFDGFYRAGSLVFGGGHVVLPLLQAEVVPSGWVSNEDFLAGYGAAQAVPGPLFTFSAYLGAIEKPEPNGIAGATVALVAIFLPSFLLVIGGLPLWGYIRGAPGVQAGLRGVNAAVVGLLLSALYQPVWTSAIGNAQDFGLALAAFGLLAFWRAPPWLVVALSALGGAALADL